MQVFHTISSSYEQLLPKSGTDVRTFHLEDADLLATTEGVLGLHDVLSLVLELDATDLELVLVATVLLHVLHALCQLRVVKVPAMEEVSQKQAITTPT